MAEHDNKPDARLRRIAELRAERARILAQSQQTPGDIRTLRRIALDLMLAEPELVIDNDEPPDA